MKRINSNSWKKPFEGELRPSQDSAYIGSTHNSQDRNQSSQCLEFSQVSTQDLFGQNSQSQKEQSNQRMSMYEKWLSKRSMKSSQRDSTALGGWNSVAFDGQGRSTNKIATPSSQTGNKFRLDDRDEHREALEVLLNSFHESEQQMKAVVYNIQDMLGKMGTSFSEQSKGVLSSFMEDIAKSQDDLMSHFHTSEKNKEKEKVLEDQLASKTQQVASLESKLKTLEDQVTNTKSDENRQSKELREELNAFHQAIMKKLEEVKETIGCQKDDVEQCRLNIQELREEYIKASKGVDNGFQELESKFLREMKRLPKNVKNEVDVKSQVLKIFEGMPVEINRSLQTKLQSFSRDIKDEFSKEHKRYNDQVLRKQLDRMLNKMDNAVSEHKKIHQSLEAVIQESMSHQLNDIDQRVKGIGDKSASDSLHLKQVQQSVTSYQDEQSEKLQNMITQQKEFCVQIKNLLKNDIESGQSRGDGSQNKYQNEKSDILVASNIPERQETRVSGRSCDSEELNPYSKSMRIDPVRSNNLSYKVLDSNVNNTWMPVINQTNIYPSSSRTQDIVFKSPLPPHVNKTRQHLLFTDKSDSNSKLPAPFGSYFKSPSQTPSPVAAIKPLSRQTPKINNDLTRGHIVAENECQTSYCVGINNGTNGDERQEHPLEPDNMSNKSNNENQETGYWLRKRNGQFYNENFYLGQIPRRTTDKRKLSESLIRHSSQRSVEKIGCGISGHSSAFNSNSSNRMIRKTPGGGRKRPLPLLNVEKFPKTPCDVSIYNFEDNEKENPVQMYRGLDVSVYDFKDSLCGTPRKRLPHKESERETFKFKEGSTVSSPALTIDLDWKETPSWKRKVVNQTTRHDGSVASSILDVC